MDAMTLPPDDAASRPVAEQTIVEWAIGARPLGGADESGDLHVVAPFRNGVLIAAIDGLGHGTEAAVAARAAASVLQSHADKPVDELTRRCHAELRKTRGAVLSVASFNAVDDTMSWLGVGNVEGMVFRADRNAKPRRETILLRGGVVGSQLPLLRAAVLPIARGDMLVFATDGIRHGFGDDSPLDRHPAEIADAILDRYGKHTDDALVLVARYRGAGP
jgi:negative regulator of sigma-B (phosphoserine phosphatase)